MRNMKGSEKLAVKRGRTRKNKAEPKKTIEQIEEELGQTKEELSEGFCIMQYSERCRKQEGKRKHSLFYTLKQGQGNEDFFKGIGLINNKENYKTYIPICKDCLKEYCYNDKGEVILERFKAFLMIANLPFIEEIYNTAVTSKMDTIGTYLTRLALPQNKELKWFDGNFFKSPTMKVKQEEVEVTHDMKKLRKKWGRNYDEDDLEVLEDWYSEIIEQCDNAEAYGTQETAKMYCRAKMDVELKRANGEKTTDSEKAVMQYMDKLAISPDKIKAKKSNHNFVIEISDIEEKKPADLFFNKLYKDIDQFGKYIKKFFARPTKNLITGSRDFDEEYRIDDEYESYLDVEEYDDGINLIDAEEYEEMMKKQEEEKGDKND